MTSKGQEKMTNYTIGVDISKDFFDVHRLPDHETARFDNTRKGHKNFIRWIGGAPVKYIVYEPTGKYHFDFEIALDDAGFPLNRVNPVHARHFARALGTYAKTDKGDARILAMMGEALNPQTTGVACQKMRDLKALQIARHALIKDRTAAKNRQKSLSVSLLKRQNATRLKQIDCDIAAIEQAMVEIIHANKDLSRTFDILCSIPGISKITAISLIVELPELGTLQSKQVASLAGLAPFTRQSGQWKGKSFIGAGRKFLREALYMPALVATRFNPDMAAMYQRLIAKGKAPKLAITAIMRKLVILANTLVKNNRIWKEKSA